MTSHHAALIYAMVLVSGSDREMPDGELRAIGEMVQHLPVFRDFDAENLLATARNCGRLLRQPDGLRHTLEEIAAALPSHLHETAYALACEVAAASGHVSPEESRVLELLRQHLKLDRLTSAAIERATRARHMTLEGWNHR